MNYYDSQKFCPSFSDEDKVRTYRVFSAVSWYNSQIDDQRSLHENLMRLVISPDSILENEMPDYIRTEILKITNTSEVFEALARGFYRYSAIQSSSRVLQQPCPDRYSEKTDRHGTGKYYHDIPSGLKNGEFDVATEDPDGYIFYETKFRSKPVTQKMTDTEIRQVNATGPHCYRYGFISGSGFEIIANQDHLILITLKDLYQ